MSEIIVSTGRLWANVNRKPPALISFVYGTWLIAQRIFFGGVITGYASLMGGMLFLSGVQLVSLGLVGIYISKIFQEVKARPTYIVRSRNGLADPGAGEGGV